MLSDVGAHCDYLVTWQASESLVLWVSEKQAPEMPNVPQTCARRKGASIFGVNKKPRPPSLWNMGDVTNPALGISNCDAIG